MATYSSLNPPSITKGWFTTSSKYLTTFLNIFSSKYSSSVLIILKVITWLSPLLELSAPIDTPYKSSWWYDISLALGYFSLPLFIMEGSNAFIVTSSLSKILWI